MTLTSEAVSPGGVTLRLNGSASFKTNHDYPVPLTFQVLGKLHYDAKHGAFDRFDVVAFAPRGHFEEKVSKRTDLGVAFELAEGKTAMDRVNPYFIDDAG